jgi:hypothetical protein
MQNLAEVISDYVRETRRLATASARLLAVRAKIDTQSKPCDFGF